MRILLDECIDWRLSRDLPGHQVKTARQLGWTSIRNGELLGRAASQFEVFLTVDRNLSHQQDLTAYPIAVVVLRSRSNRLEDLRKLLPELLAQLERTQPGTASIVGERV